MDSKVLYRDSKGRRCVSNVPFKGSKGRWWCVLFCLMFENGNRLTREFTYLEALRVDLWIRTRVLVRPHWWSQQGRFELMIGKTVFAITYGPHRHNILTTDPNNAFVPWHYCWEADPFGNILLNETRHGLPVATVTTRVAGSRRPKSLLWLFY